MIPKLPATISKTSQVIRPDKGRAFVTFSHGTSKKAAVITSAKSGTTVKRIDAKLSSRSVLFQGLPGCTDAVIDDCRLISGGSLVDCGLGGVTNLAILDCGCDVPTATFGMIYFGGKRGIDPVNRNIKLVGCWSAGSIHEHILRVHNTDGLAVANCDFQNPQKAPWAVKRGACLNLRDVNHVAVFNSRGSGQVILGPLADGDGGINYSPGPERDRLLGLRCEDVLFDGFELAGGYFILEAGTRKIVMKNMSGHLLGSGSLFTFEKAYGPRPRPREITLENVHFTGDPKAKFISGAADKLTLKNCTWNGKGMK